MKKLLILIVFKLGLIYNINCQSRFEVIRINKIKSDFSICVSMFDSETNDSLKLSDIWIGNQRFPSDSNGVINLKLSCGRYLLHARSFGYVNKKIRLKIRKNESIKLNVYLKPYIFSD